MKFRRLDLIRHRNGTAEFEVVADVRPEGMYVLRKVGESSLYSMAASLVDSMFIGVSPGNPTKFEKIVRLGLGYGMDPAALDRIAVKRGYKPDTGCGVNQSPNPTLSTGPDVAVSLPTLSIGPDVAVSLPGLPARYYLKAFRKALPGDLVLNTSGAVVPARITPNGMTLYRPIVGRVSDIHKWSDPTSRIPGVPEGWTVIAYRKPKPGEQCLRLGSTEVFTCKEDDWAVKQCYVIVQKIQRITPCDGTLPGIPKGYKLVGFGAVKGGQFYIDTVGNLETGPAKHRLILEQLPVKPLEVVTEYEIDCYGGTAWAAMAFYHFPEEINTRYTGRTRKVVVQ